MLLHLKDIPSGFNPKVVNFYSRVAFCFSSLELIQSPLIKAVFLVGLAEVVEQRFSDQKFLN